MPIGDEAAEWRWWIWNSMSFLGGDPEHVLLGNAVLRANAAAGGGHFWTSAVSTILAHYSNELDDDVAVSLKARLASLLPAEIGQRFRGYNDNFPAMAALSLLVGAPHVGREDLIDEGLLCLRSLQGLFRRRGMLSEHTSPTYTPITLSCLADIAEFSPSPEARSMALAAERQVWADVCSRFHPATSTVAGPYSRAYTVDLCGHPHDMHMVLYMVFGAEAVALNPLNAMMPPMPNQILHHGTAAVLRGHTSWHVTPTYHLTPALERLALDKGSDAVEIRASSEQAAFHRNVWETARHPTSPLAEFAAGEVHAYTRVEPEFAFGVADRTFLDGMQHAPFHVLYSKRQGGRRVRTVDEVGTIFSRFVSDDRVHDGAKHAYDEGRALGAASGDRAIVLYRGRPGWGSGTTPIDYLQSPVRSLKLSLLMRDSGDPALMPEIWLGDERATLWNARSDDCVPVLVNAGGMFAALYPLPLTNLGRGHAVRIERIGVFGAVSFVNYDGPARTFGDGEMATCLNGFAAKFARASAYDNDFAAFRAIAVKQRVEDHYAASDAMRYTSFRWADDELAMAASPVSDGIMFATDNGKPLPKPWFTVDERDLSMNCAVDDDDDEVAGSHRTGDLS